MAHDANPRAKKSHKVGALTRVYPTGTGMLTWRYKGPINNGPVRRRISQNPMRGKSDLQLDIICAVETAVLGGDGHARRYRCGMVLEDGASDGKNVD